MNDVVRPVSRLPRPVVAGRSRTQPAVHRPVRASQVHHGSSLPLIDLGNGRGTRRSRRNSVADGQSILQESINSRIPVPSLNDHVTTAFSNYRRSSHSSDRLVVQRPQTSCSSEGLSARVHRRKTSSGKTHLLKKLQTMSLGSHADIAINVEDGDSSSRFARLQPLPAIVRPSLENSEMSSLEAESLLDFPKNIDMDPGQTVNDHLNETDFPTNDEDIEVQRPATSYFIQRPDSAIVKEASSLVRSRTYDIIPTGNTSNDWTIKEDDEETEEIEDSDDPVGDAVERSEDSSYDHVAAAAVTEVGLLLAIRSPSDDEEDQCYGYFNEEDKVQTILDFYQEVTGKSNERCHLAHQEDNGKQRRLDSESTIAEAKLANRAVVHLMRPVDETSDEEILNQEPRENEETIT